MAIKWYTQKQLCVHDDQEFNFVKVTKAYSSKDYFQKINYMKGHLLIYESCIALAHSEHSFFLIFPICFEERIDYTAEFMAKKKRQRSKPKTKPTFLAMCITSLTVRFFQLKSAGCLYF